MASYIGNYLLNPAFPLSELARATLERGDSPKFVQYIETVKNEFTYLNKRGKLGPF